MTDHARILAAAKIARSTIVDQWDAFVKALEDDSVVRRTDKPEGGTFFEDKYGVLRDKPEEYELPASYKKPEAREPEMPTPRMTCECGREMIWNDLTVQCPVAMCPRCVLQRMRAAERQRDEALSLLREFNGEFSDTVNAAGMRDWLTRTRAALSASREGA